MTLGRICELCDEIVTSDTIWAHYDEKHPHLHRGDWELKCWPDSTAAIVDAGYEALRQKAYDGRNRTLRADFWRGEIERLKPDRLAEELRREARRIGSSRLSDLALISADEVERLRDSLAFPPDWTRSRGAAELEARQREIKALRGALQALVDAVDDNEFAGFFTARAAAVALLAGPGGET